MSTKIIKTTKNIEGRKEIYYHSIKTINDKTHQSPIIFWWTEEEARKKIEDYFNKIKRNI